MSAPRISPYPLVPFNEALARVLAQVGPLPAVPRRWDTARGSVLAEAVRAAEALPPFAASTVDGFAVRAGEGVGERRLVGTQFAGYDAALHVGAGEAARITTGAPLPAGADAVMMVEWSQETEGYVRFTRSVGSGDFVRPIGSDVAAGQRLLDAGTLLGPAEVGLLATVGTTEVQVHRRPIVGVMSTGDELVEPDQTPGPGQIRDANRFALLAAVAEAGGEPLDLGLAPDVAGPLERFIRDGLTRCDVLLTSGGVSMGELDLVKPLLAQRGTVHFGRVRVRPGKPTTFAMLDGKPVFALPGNPVSALVCFELFVRPALRKMQGLPEGAWLRPRLPATLAHPIRHEADRTEFQRASLRWDGAAGHFVAATTGPQQSSRLLSLVGANTLLCLPEGRADFATGDVVEAWVVAELGIDI